MDINDIYLPSLSQHCGLKLGDELPQAVVDKFWEYKRVKDRIGPSILNDIELCFICVLAGQGALKPEVDIKPVTFADLVKQGVVKQGDKLSVKWRNAITDVTFNYLSASDQANVTFLEGGMERNISPKIVQLPELANA